MVDLPLKESDHYRFRAYGYRPDMPVGLLRRFWIKATIGNHKFLAEHGIKFDHILKMHEGRPNIVDDIVNGEIQLIINTPAGG